MSKPNGARYLVVSGNLYLARSRSTGRGPRGAWTKRRSEAARFYVAAALEHASRFWGGGVVQA